MRSRFFIFFAVLFVLSGFLWAQSGTSDSSAEDEAGSDSPVSLAGIQQRADEFGLGLELRLGGSATSIVPAVHAEFGLPLYLGSEFSVTPHAGFLYFFDVWTEVHDSYYLPVGLTVLYSPLNLGIDASYLLPLSSSDQKHHISASLIGRGNLLQADSVEIDFELGLGPALILFNQEYRILFKINSSLILRYSF